MKIRILGLILSAILVLMTGCSKIPERSDRDTRPLSETEASATQLQAAEKPTETAAPTDLTDPPEIPARDSDMPVWMPNVDEMFSADGFTSTQCSYTDDLPPTQWHVTVEGKQHLYRIYMTENGLAIEGTGMEGVYLVPGSEQVADCKLAGADGRVAYVYNNSLIWEVDLHSGDLKPIVNPTRVHDVWMCEAGIYYLVEWGWPDEQELRVYLRQGDWLQIYPLQTDFPVATSLFAFEHPVSNHSDFYWTELNPQMLDVLKKELEDQNSSYRSVHPACWDSYNIRDDVEHKDALKALCMDLQEDTGIPALVKVRYGTADKIRLKAIPVFLE